MWDRPGASFLPGPGPGITKFDRGRAGDFLTDNFKTTKIVMNEIMAIFFQISSVKLIFIFINLY